MISIGTKIRDESDNSVWEIVDINGDEAEVIAVTPEDKSTKDAFVMEFQTGKVLISQIKPEDIVI
jgi:hypothetical protein